MLTDFKEIYRLLEASFPSDELREKADFLSLRENDLFHALILKEEGKIAGFAGVWLFSGTGYIEYLAVSPTLRNRGLGKAMLEEIFSLFPEPFILEAEPEEMGGMAPRRIGFYRRLGFQVNSFSYLQPAYSKKKKPLPLSILSRPNLLSEEEFCRNRDLLYENVYHFHPEKE